MKDKPDDRKSGWRDRRRLHVLEAKAPVPDPEDDPVYEAYHDDGWTSCDECGCCRDLEWYAPVMHPMTVVHDGLVHVTLPRDRTTVCGAELFVDSPLLGSTDEAKAWSRANAGDARMITCIQCVAEAHFWAVRWWG